MSRMWLLLLFTYLYFAVGQNDDANSRRLYVSNLNSTCMRCLCEAATSCQFQACENGYCGPFYISKVYWADAEKFVLKDDDSDRDKAWQDCALDYDCASGIVTRFMKKYGMDCNGDRVVNCYDYARLHNLGGYSCSAPLDATFEKRFSNCMNVSHSYTGGR